MDIEAGAWQDFVLLAHVVYKYNEDADFYDVFDIWRTKILSAQPYSEEFLEKIDAEIELEEQQNARRTNAS